MFAPRVWTVLALVCVLGVPTLVVTRQEAVAAGTPKAEWRPAKGVKAAPKTKKAAASAVLAQVEPKAGPPASEAPPQSATQVAPILDQSQEVLDIDFAMAAAIATNGPKDGYASALSDEGILYDANGASPAGKEAATARFGTFPADVLLVRTPERALAAGGSGSSWGTYTIKRSEAILSAGRYVSVWRREATGWKMMSELAAGKTFVPPPSTPSIGVLPKRPAQLGRATPAPVGVPLTVPTPPQAATAAPTVTETTPTP